MSNIEVLCLEGLEDACIGYQVVLKGNAPNYINPPIFVNFNDEMTNHIAGGDRYYFDDDQINNHTLH